MSWKVRISLRTQQLNLIPALLTRAISGMAWDLCNGTYTFSYTLRQKGMVQF
jgi:hypothetical protein